MLEIEKKDMLQIENQLESEVEKKLEYLCQKLKEIPEISIEYMEYMAALIYMIGQDNLEKTVFEELEYKELAKVLDEHLEDVKYKNSDTPFSNIRFQDIIHESNYNSFQKVIKELQKMIQKNGKKEIAEAYERAILKAAKKDEINLKNGEFYTAKGVIKAMVNLFKMQDNMKVYDPSCSTGGFLVESLKMANLEVYGEETNKHSYNIAKTNVWLHGAELKKDREIYEQEEQKYDFIYTNPPFKEQTKLDNKMDNYCYGRSPTDEYTKILFYSLNRLKSNGKMAIILPHGFLFKRIGRKNRKELIEKNYIDAIIGLPENLFYGTRIPVIILVIKKAKQNREVLFIDASREYTSKRRNNILEVKHQNKIITTYQNYKEIEGYSYIASIEEIENNDYDLSIKKYVKLHKETEKINPIEMQKSIYQLEYEKQMVQEKIAKIIDKHNLIK